LQILKVRLTASYYYSKTCINRPPLGLKNMSGLFRYANDRKSREINEKGGGGGGKDLTTDSSDAHNLDHCILITFVINCIILNKYFNEKYCFIMTQYLNKPDIFFSPKGGRFIQVLL
jgi:hypothetical protein